MTVVTRADLTLRDYSWSALANHDNPHLTHFPDNAELNRTEGYEVLSFINRFLAVIRRGAGGDWTKDDVRKIEHGVRIHPDNIRGQANVRKWICDNWIRL